MLPFFPTVTAQSVSGVHTWFWTEGSGELRRSTVPTARGGCRLGEAVVKVTMSTLWVAGEAGTSLLLGGRGFEECPGDRGRRQGLEAAQMAGWRRSN